MKTILLLCGCALTAFGHHSMAGFDRAKSVSLTGTIKQFKWANPHSWIEVEFTNDKGALEDWNVEMTAPAQLIRAGWKSSSLKPGDKVTIVCRPQLSGEPGGLFVSVTLANGTVLTERPPQASAAKQ